MIPATPSEQCAHARDILNEPGNATAFYPELREILAYWLDLEAEMLKQHAQDPLYRDPDLIDHLPSIRMARWIMKSAGCGNDES